MTTMRATFAIIPSVPSAKMRAASAVPPGWHWNTLVALELALLTVLPNRKLAPIIATADPVDTRLHKFIMSYAVGLFKIVNVVKCGFTAVSVVL